MTQLDSSRSLVVCQWRRSEGSIRDISSLRHERRPGVGLVPGMINEAWSATGSLDPGEYDDHDLTALPYSAFGSHFRAFGCLRELMVVNLETADGAILQVGAGGPDPVAGLFMNTNDAVLVGEDGCFFLGSPNTNITIDASSRILRIKNVGPTQRIHYQLALLGTGTDIPLPAAKTAEQDPRFILGDNGSWDVERCGTATYAVAQGNWGGAAAIAWYAFWHEKQGTIYCSPSVNNDVITGLPAAKGIWAGTVDRLVANLVSNPLIGFYLTLTQIATTAGLNQTNTSTWPRSRPLWDSHWDALSPPPSGWDVSDIGSEGRWIDLANANARELSAVKNAEIVQEAKANDPEINCVFSDNFSLISGTTAWDQLIDVASRFIEKVTPLGVGLIVNATPGSYTGELGSLPTSGDLTGYWDDAEAAGGPGIMALYNEGCSSCHQLRTDNTLANGKSSFDSAIDNVQNWLARTWPGGGRRGILAQPFSSVDGLPSSGVIYGANRRVVVTAATVIDANTIELVTSTEHFIADTSYKKCIPQSVHAALNGLDFDPTVIDDVTLRITKTAHGISSFSLTADSGLGFPFSGLDVDFGWLHALRKTGDFTLVQWNPQTGVAPLWLDDITDFGEVVGGSLSVVSTHVVNIGTAGSPVNRTCAKEIKYQFASGPVGERWHHVRFDVEGRRRWKASS